jgi:hypothetical protein
VKSRIVKYFLGRRLARMLPGGWIGLLLLPIAKRVLQRAYAHRMARRARTFHRRVIPTPR